MENKAHALAAGSFVVLAAALLVALAVWLTRDTGVRLSYEVSTRDAVTGLQPQATVRFRGVKVGKVSGIGFDSRVRGNVLLRLAIDADTPITRSTFATLGFQGVTGIAFVQLDDSGESQEWLRSSEESPARIPMRPGLVSQLSEQGTRILGQLEESSRRVNQLLSPEHQQTLMTSIGALGQAAASAEEVKKAAAEFGRLAQRVQQPGGVLDQLTQGAGALSSTGQTLQADTLPRLNRSVAEADRAARQVGRAATTLSDNPQMLLFGHPPAAPGPGEPGFVVPGGKP